MKNSLALIFGLCYNAIGVKQAQAVTPRKGGDVHEDDGFDDLHWLLDHGILHGLYARHECR